MENLQLTTYSLRLTAYNLQLTEKKITMNKLFQLILVAGISFPCSIHAQIDVSMIVESDQITVNYEPKSDYNAAPYNLWNSQLLSVRYPDNFNLTWQNMEQLSDFDWVCDPLTPDSGVNGGDGFIYKTFYSSNTPMINLIKEEAFPVFKISFLPVGEIPIEIVSSGNWIKENSMELAINNAISGNEFGEIKEVPTTVSTNDLERNGWEVKNLYPVPTEQTLYLEFNSRIYKETDGRIYDLKGNELEIFPISMNEGQSTMKLDVDHLPAGIYHLIIDKQLNQPLQFEKI